MKEPQAFDNFGYPGKWVTLKNGEHLFVRNGESVDTAVMRLRLSRTYSGLPNHIDVIRRAEQAGVKIPMTPEEKIASVHIVAGQDNVLPELNEGDLQKIGVTQNKPVLIKASIFERNANKHSEVPFEDIDIIIGQALYSEDTNIVLGKNESGTYYVFYKPIRPSKKKKDEMNYGTVILDIREENDYFEVVHWQWVREKNMPSVDLNFKK